MADVTDVKPRLTKRIRRTNLQLAADFAEEQRKLQQNEKVRITLMLCYGCKNVYTIAAKHRCGLEAVTSSSSAFAAAQDDGDERMAVCLQAKSDDDEAEQEEAEENEDVDEVDRSSARKKPRTRSQQQPVTSAHGGGGGGSSASTTPLSDHALKSLRHQWVGSVRAVRDQCQAILGPGRPSPSVLARLIESTDELQHYNHQLWQFQSQNESAAQASLAHTQLFGDKVKVCVQTTETGFGKHFKFDSSPTASARSASISSTSDASESEETDDE